MATQKKLGRGLANLIPTDGDVTNNDSLKPAKKTAVKTAVFCEQCKF